MGGLSRIRLDGLANNSVANTNIVDGAVGAAEIATGAVKATEVAAGGIAANTAFADGVVTQNVIAAGNVVTSKINNAAVTAAKIAAGNVVTAALNAGAVTDAKIATGTISSAKLSAGIINATVCANKEGFDALVIGCFYDTALHDAREVSGDMVVVAPCHSSIEIALSLSNNFGIIVGRRKWVNQMKSAVHEYGYGEKLTGFYDVGLGVDDFQADHQKTTNLLIDASKHAVEKDYAESIILGCTAEFGFYKFGSFSFELSKILRGVLPIIFQPPGLSNV